MYNYCLTLRKVALPTFISEYEDKIRLLQDAYPYAKIEKHYEPEKGLHVHCLVTSHRRLYVRQILQKMRIDWGWSCKFEECHSFGEFWAAYIRWYTPEAHLQLVEDELLKEIEFNATQENVIARTKTIPVLTTQEIVLDDETELSSDDVLTETEYTPPRKRLV